MKDVLATIAPRRGNREALLAQGKTSAVSGTLGIDAQQANALKGQKQTPRMTRAYLFNNIYILEKGLKISPFI